MRLLPSARVCMLSQFGQACEGAPVIQEDTGGCGLPLDCPSAGCERRDDIAETCLAYATDTGPPATTSEATCADGRTEVVCSDPGRGGRWYCFSPDGEMIGTWFPSDILTENECAYVSGFPCDCDGDDYPPIGGSGQ